MRETGTEKHSSGHWGLLIEYLAIKINKNASLDIILVFFYLLQILTKILHSSHIGFF